VSKLPSTDHLCNHGSPARLEEENVSTQSIKIHALNMFPHPINISLGHHIFHRIHDKRFMGQSKNIRTVIMFPHTQSKIFESQIFFVELKRMFTGQENVCMQVKYFIGNPNFSNKIYTHNASHNY